MIRTKRLNSKMTATVFFRLIALVVVVFFGSVFDGAVKAQSCVSAPGGLVSWWPGDGNANDISGTNGGTLVNGATFGSGIVGQAFSLDGVDDYVDLGAGVNGGPQGTVDMWVKSPKDTSQALFSISIGNNPQDAEVIGLGPWTGTLQDELITVAKVTNTDQNWILGYETTNRNQLFDGSWHHIAVVFHGGSTLPEIYLDGVSKPISINDFGPPDFDYGFAGADSVLIGATKRSGSVDTHFGGFIDEVEVFNRALTAGEIAAIYNAGSAGKCKVMDADEDGIDDDVDNCPNTSNPDQDDTDLDGAGDACDACPEDLLNDGDGDGFCGNVDNCPSVFNPNQTDTDGDGVGDVCNEADDPDDDEFATAFDNCPAVFNPDQADGDEDGFGDLCDICPQDALNDADGDGLCESDDNCPTVANSDQNDLDQDGEGDACDLDIDGDGKANDDDNCVFDVNPDQLDFDGDGAGNVCDMDDDGDGVIDADDACVPTPVGEVVDNDGCSISQICPCEHPVGGSKWKNHGAYVSCVAHASEDFVNNGRITEEDKDAIVSAAGGSNCGHKKK